MLLAIPANFRGKHSSESKEGDTATPWTTTDLRLLKAESSLGAVKLSELLGRSVSSVEAAAHRQRISLRRSGCRRGSVLGQPRGVSLLPALRSDLIDPKIAELVAQRMKVNQDAPLCPRCAARTIRVESTGLCVVCHRQVLAEAHREVLAEISSQQALWAARQDLQRARRRLGVSSPSCDSADAAST